MEIDILIKRIIRISETYGLTYDQALETLRLFDELRR